MSNKYLVLAVVVNVVNSLSLLEEGLLLDGQVVDQVAIAYVVCVYLFPSKLIAPKIVKTKTRCESGSTISQGLFSTEALKLLLR